MARPGLVVLALVLAGRAAPALADGSPRDFCADRPGLGTPACTIAPGHFQVEIGLADWTLDRQAGLRVDTVTAGDALVRIGLLSHTEVQLGWTAYGRVRTRDTASGAIDHVAGSGDLTVALRQNLHHPDGAGTSFALMPYLTLPTGGTAVGAGDWSAGVRVPAGVDLGHGLSFALTPEVDAAVNGDRKGRHLAFGGVAGLGIDLGERVNATAELAAFRDDDPSGHETVALAGLSLAWQSSAHLQLDAGANVGLDRASPDVELYVGVARGF